VAAQGEPAGRGREAPVGDMGQGCARPVRSTGRGLEDQGSDVDLGAAPTQSGLLQGRHLNY
jgi:hypothetical protein